MHPFAILLIAACLLDHSQSKPVGSSQTELQVPLADLTGTHHQSTTSQRLHGRFLHITDLHPDPFYKVHSSTEEEDACHRGQGTSGTYGAETSDCDTPFALINATFKWIAENIKDEIDFVIWTGDSARHDSDEKLPRNAEEVLNTNRWIANRFAEVFSKSNDPKNSLTIPIIPTFGNNDILPHNILLSGPNKWLKTYTDVWSKFIPEEQRHGFERGGWYYVEVIPQKLAIFSLNTLYFFSHNAAVDGCALRSEPGYEHMEWLRIQLQFMRQRGMKAILTGHVPPARTDSKQLWDETCWQKYTLWLQQYRDVVVGGFYGHMNIDHFMLQDTRQVNLLTEDELSENQVIRARMDEELSIDSASDYLEELRDDWSSLPNPAIITTNDDSDTSKKGKKGKKGQERKKARKNLGGPWGERYHVTHVGPSVVPNFFPTLRVVEYNITGLDEKAVWANTKSWIKFDPRSISVDDGEIFNEGHGENDDDVEMHSVEDLQSTNKEKKKKGKKHKKKKPSDPDLNVPSPPSKREPPGPAYSPQSLTLLGYTQYFANLTYINNDQFAKPDDVEEIGDGVDTTRWHEGKHKGKHPKDKVPHPKTFRYQVEYDTFTDPIYKLKDLTVKSYIRLAHRIGQYKPEKGDQVDAPFPEETESEDEVENPSDGDDDDDEDDDNYCDETGIGDDDNHLDVGKHKKKHKKHKKHNHHKRHEKNKVWLRFIQRAFIGTLEEDERQHFDQSSEPVIEIFDPVGITLVEPHDGEL